MARLIAGTIDIELDADLAEAVRRDLALLEHSHIHVEYPGKLTLYIPQGTPVALIASPAEFVRH